MYTKATFARQLKSILDSRGMTQVSLAERLKTTETTVSRYVSGVRTPNIEIAVEIARILGVSMDALVGVEPPAAKRIAPDVNILMACYDRMTDDDRRVLWTLLDRYLNPEQRALIQSIQRQEANEAI